jgi:HEAT repeat protein
VATPHRPPPAERGDFRPRTARALGLAALVTAALAAVALVIASLERPWEPEPGLPPAPAGTGAPAPGAQAIPAPAVEPGAGLASWRDTLSRWLRGSDAAALAPLRDLVDLARDPTTPLELRVGAVRWIARDGGQEGLEFLEDLLSGDAPASLRAAIAEAIGESPQPDARTLLEDLLESDDEALARGALRGLARGPDAPGLLASVLRDGERPLAVRAQAAGLLGTLEAEEASAALRSALPEIDDAALAAHVLDALGEHPFARNADAFRAVLANPALPRELKIEALEALGDSGTDSAALLLDYAARAPEPELRAAAVEAIAFLDDSDAIAPWLLRLVESEPSPDVRAEIYASLGFHARATYAAADADRLVDVILSETGGPVRLQAFRLAATILRTHPDPRLVEAFDARMVPWLQDEALRAPGRAQRLACLDTLQLARTPEATAALERLARSHDAAVAEAAARALRSGSRASALTVP